MARTAKRAGPGGLAGGGRVGPGRLGRRLVGALGVCPDRKQTGITALRRESSLRMMCLRCDGTGGRSRACNCARTSE